MFFQELPVVIVLGSFAHRMRKRNKTYQVLKSTGTSLTQIKHHNH
jgi:hypothetical protein